MTALNPFLTLDYEPAFESLGEDYADLVAAASFPRQVLRFRNDDLLERLGLSADQVQDEHFLEAFGRFEGRSPFLAMRYHGYQFGQYNPELGDGRGFLYGQVRDRQGQLQDLGTKGSGTTPYSRTADGRLTLKGGVREVIAAEALHRMGVRTSRCLSLIETGEALWRGDEPSPTRSSVMVRMARSHIRFGTFERLHHFQRKDLIQTLLDHVIEHYYPHLQGDADGGARFYGELVERVAELAAQWMAAGFCHAVLNTDNMTITGESFDYGPYAFIPSYNLRFTAAYFDYFGRYCYGQQPLACRWNLEMLQAPLGMVLPAADLEAGLAQYFDHFQRAYERLMLRKLGFGEAATLGAIAPQLVEATLQLLQETQASYHGFFGGLAASFTLAWRAGDRPWPRFQDPLNDAQQHCLEQWQELYQQALETLPLEAMDSVKDQLQQANPATVPVRPAIEAVWEPIATEDNWLPFYELLERIRA